MAHTILHKADSRGLADHGWLKSFHTFSFGDYYNPERIQFGVLRVLNDDTVSGGRGFGDHPHDNMEIISIPMEGELVHKDSMNNKTVIKPGEIQVMSAGTGIYHTEYNNNENQPVKFLQIWVYPNRTNLDQSLEPCRATNHGSSHDYLSKVMMKTEILVIGTHPKILKTILRLINNRPEWNAIGVFGLEEALNEFQKVDFKIVLLGAGLATEREEELCDQMKALKPQIRIVRHYGGGSGLLYAELQGAIKN